MNSLQARKTFSVGPFDFSYLLPVMDLSGRFVDAAASAWRLNNPTTTQVLNWERLPITSPQIFEATVAYVVELIKTRAPSGVFGCFGVLPLLGKSPAFIKADRDGDIIPAKVISEVRVSLGSEGYRARLLRSWYLWCCDQGYENFSPEVAFELREMKFGGNEKATAVLSMDPESGPLTDTEMVLLLNGLTASGHTGRLTLQERAALWVCISLGCNPSQIVLLREGDIERLGSKDEDGGLYTLNVPRMKKRDTKERTQFKARKLTADIGAILEELIEANRVARDARGGTEPGYVAPLFARETARASVLGGPTHEYAMALTASDFTRFVNAAVQKLGITSPRTGKALNVTCRRFRYTYATRLVREGASQRAVAEALDHTDLQHVQCYFDLKSDIVEKLDKAMALALAPVAQAFLGHLVRSEKEAVRGDRPSSRINAEGASGRIEAVGTCGSLSFCGLFAPRACYTCIKFQPWLDGPHEEVLDTLLTERSRREESGLDGRMVAINDTTIKAVADVVHRVATIRQTETADVG